MKTGRNRIVTTHVGSLPRSAVVTDLLEAREHRQDDKGNFDREVRQAVDDIVRRQAETGVDVVSDGESSKISYATYVRDRLDGFSEEGSTEASKPHLDLQPFPDLQKKMALLTGPRRFKRVSCVGPVKIKDNLPLQQDLDNFGAAVAKVRPFDAFMNSASPGVVTSFLANSYYPSHEAYLAAVAEAMRAEYEAIVAAGFVLQVDCPDLAMSRHTAFQDLSEDEFLRRASLHVEALNHALQRVPEGKVRIHVCWGNYEGPHTADIDLRKIVATVLRAKAAAISLEAANPRHAHEWEIWQEVKLPEGKILLPGVIDTSTNYVEHPDLVAERIARFANVVGRERVMASTDCGFGTSAGHGKVDAGVAFLKLAALVEGAKRATKRLWTS